MGCCYCYCRWRTRQSGRQKRANSSISTIPLKFEDVQARNAFEYLQMIYIARNQNYWPKFLPLIVWVYIRQFSRNQAYASKSNPLNLKLLVQKPSFTRNSHSGSFQVIHFALSHRPTRGSISSYNTAGLSTYGSTYVTDTYRPLRPSHIVTSSQIQERFQDWNGAVPQWRPYSNGSHYIGLHLEHYYHHRPAYQINFRFSAWSQFQPPSICEELSATVPRHCMHCEYCGTVACVKQHYKKYLDLSPLLG